MRRKEAFCAQKLIENLVLWMRLISKEPHFCCTTKRRLPCAQSDSLVRPITIDARLRSAHPFKSPFAAAANTIFVHCTTSLFRLLLLLRRRCWMLLLLLAALGQRRRAQLIVVADAVWQLRLAALAAERVIDRLWRLRCLAHPPARQRRLRKQNKAHKMLRDTA